MTYYVYFLFLSVLSASDLINHVSPLNAEGIANGIIANQSNFRYQAAIFGRKNLDSTGKVLCSGVIINLSWILSVAHCFMENSVELKKLIFTVIAGARDITSQSGLLENIAYIYTYGYDAHFYFNDIAMAKTAKNLLLDFPGVNKIDIADSRMYMNFVGIVSGYGSSELITEDEQGDTYIIEFEPDLKMRYTTVKVSSSLDCYYDFPFISTYDKFCGVADYNENMYTGMCENDAGNPLVIDNKLVGLSSIGHEDCDDTHRGSLYTVVSNYIYFIQSVLLNRPIASFLKHDIHITEFSIGY